MYRVLVRCLTYARPWRSVTNSLSETVPSELASLTQLQELCAAHARRGLARFGAARRRSARARSGDGGALAQRGRPKASVALGALRGRLAARLARPTATCPTRVAHGYLPQLPHRNHSVGAGHVFVVEPRLRPGQRTGREPSCSGLTPTAV